MKHYSIIWDGSEANVSEQMNFISKWASANGARVKSWKDKTIQDRVCQYVGNPKIRKNHYGNTEFKKRNLERKYTILEMSDSTLSKFKALVGSAFQFTTFIKNEYAVVDAFTVMKHTDELTKDYFFNNIKEKFNDKETAVKEITARLSLNPNQERKFNSKTVNMSRNGPLWVKLEEVIVTNHDEIFQPWVVIDDAGLGEIGEIISSQTGTDITELQKRERELIDTYNANNNACGRLGRMRADVNYSDEVVAAYRARETAGRELTAVRRELGAAKRKMTTAAKKERGIEYDMTPFSIV